MLLYFCAGPGERDRNGRGSADDLRLFAFGGRNQGHRKNKSGRFLRGVRQE